MKQENNIIIEELITEESLRANIFIYLLRLDLMDTVTGGNKYFKLKYNLEEAKKNGHDTLLTFGGAFSNHIAATAAAGKLNGFKTIGIIRGEEPEKRSHTLQAAKLQGMELVFWSREKYKAKSSQGNISELEKDFGRFYLLPEGGSNSLAVKGCAEILGHVKVDYDVACAPVGTGATLAGVVSSLKEGQKALGFSALKGGAFLKDDVLALLHNYQKNSFNREKAGQAFDIITNYHFGGYAKHNEELLVFIKEFQRQYNIPLDFVYTGKMMYGIMQLVSTGYFEKRKKILIIHTGGLQGNEGLGLIE